ncbi:glycosyltransferase [Leptolyngbya sp. O-77]|uniref:glycosyltransferase n=1 Tax=Leptolyngbya sp. O-77 TaxID=1080068 RepID=UPI00074D49F8|nr:glycosyltransferase [Leptolyngbya sp. O-77]BAU44003.1 D-inositol-3-phosphate glycosyltransferase [Leptolyngbya sp. O-77]
MIQNYLSISSKPYSSSLHKSELQINQRVILFDLQSTGHHAAYITHLVRYWDKNSFPGEVSIVVSPEFIQRHSAVVSLVGESDQAKVRFIPISDQEFEQIQQTARRWGKAGVYLQEWRLLCRYARLLQATHCLAMYLDTCELPLVLGFKPPCRLSGIYFRPTFHYGDFSSEPHSISRDLQIKREKLFVHRTLRNPSFQILFCLDPLVEKTLRQKYPDSNLVTLPDPVDLSTQVNFDLAALRKEHSIEPGRQVFLLFGSIDARKGVYQVLQSLLYLHKKVSQKICLLIVGSVKLEEKSSIQSSIEATLRHSSAQIITHFEFVSDESVHHYFQLADVVLAPYQRHVGMSGILLLAAAARKPVLSSNYGLMGELVRRYELGLIVDSTQPKEIALGIAQMLVESQSFCNLDKMKRFAEENSAENFARTIFFHLMNLGSHN